MEETVVLAVTVEVAVNKLAMAHRRLAPLELFIARDFYGEGWIVRWQNVPAWFVNCC